MRNTILARRSLKLETRLANDIANEFNPARPNDRDVAACKRYRERYPNAIPRTSDLSFGYNCHGLTFGARRTQIWSEIDHILREDGYWEVSKKEAMAGDIAIYQSIESNEIEHSGIVVEVEKDPLLGPLVVSKWGNCQELIHYYTQCPYVPAHITFHRIIR
jgi:hypothetical protein